MASTARGRRLAALFIALFIIGWILPVDLVGWYRAQYSAYLPLALRNSGATPVASSTDTATATALLTASPTPTHTATATPTRTPTPTATQRPVIACPRSGAWHGTTSEGFVIEMSVADAPSCEVSWLEILIWCPGFAWQARTGQAPIAEGHFEAAAHNEFHDVDIVVTGDFASPTQASGTWFSAGDCQGTWSAVANLEYVYQGLTEQDKPIQLGVAADYSVVNWVDLERTVSCDGITAYRGGRITSETGWPIVDGAFAIEVPDVLEVEGAFDESYVTVSGTWQGIIAGPYHPFGGSCRSPIGRWEATRQ